MGDIKNIGQFALSWKSIEELKTPLYILTALVALMYVVQIVNLGILSFILLLAVFIALIVAVWKYSVNEVLVKALSLKGYTTRTIGFLNYIAYYIVILIATLIPWFGGNYLWFQIGMFLLGIIGVILLFVAKSYLIGTLLAVIGFGIYFLALIYTSIRISFGLPAYISSVGGITDAILRSWNITSNNVIESTLIRLGNWIYGMKAVLLFFALGAVLMVMAIVIMTQDPLRILSSTPNPAVTILQLLSEIVFAYVSIFLNFTSFFGDSAVLAMLEGKNGNSKNVKKTA